MVRDPFVNASQAALTATAVVVAVCSVGCRQGVKEPAPVSDAGPASPGIVYSITPPNALPMPSASVDAVVNPENLPSYHGATGSVEGTVYVEGPPSPDVPALDVKTCPAAIDTFGKLFRSGPPNAKGERPLADAVVVVTGYSGYFLPARAEVEHVTITVNCGYPKRAIALTFGQKLEVSNDSKVPFAPNIDGVFQPAVMIAPPHESGEPIKLYPPRPGHFLLEDRLQPFAKADLYVLRQPLHDVTDVAGHYRIDGVPVGSLRIGALLNAIRSEVQKEFTVRADVVEHVDFVLRYDPDAGAPLIERPHVIP